MAYDKIKVVGMVISAMPVGEHDTRIVLLTKEKGKVSAFARGARRAKSHLMAGCRPFSFGTFELYAGKNSYTVTDISIDNYFEEISVDIEATYYGFYFLEMADYYCRENMDCRQILKLLYQSLRALINENISNRLVRIIYELKTLVINGEYPQVFECVNCGSEGNATFFSAHKCGVLCSECRHLYKDAAQVNTSTIYTMQYVVTSKIEKLYTFTVTEEVLAELEMIMKRYFLLYVDKSFKSLEIIHSLEYNTMDYSMKMEDKNG